MKFSRIALVLIMAALLPACATQVPPNTTYTAGVRANSGFNRSYFQFQTTFTRATGEALPSEFSEQMNQVLMDAAQKHGLAIGPRDGTRPYRLETSIQVAPEKHLWKAAPHTGRNFGMAVIPVAGFFTPRYYTISSAFTATFTLYKEGASILSETVVIDDQKEISVSPPNRSAQVTVAAVRFWEAKRDQAIEKFFSALSEKAMYLASD